MAGWVYRQNVCVYFDWRDHRAGRPQIHARTATVYKIRFTWCQTPCPAQTVSGRFL